MDGALARGRVVGSTDHLAVDGEDLARQLFAQPCGPRRETLRQFAGVQRRHDAADGVVAGDAVRQRQEGAEESEPGFAEGFDLDITVCSTDDRAEHKSEHFQKVELFGAIHTRIVQIAEEDVDRGKRRRV